MIQQQPIEGQPSGPRFDQAMLASVMRSVFSKPIMQGGKPLSQTSQGGMGQLGASQGLPQGAIGAAVPQMGTPAPGSSPQPSPAAPTGAPGAAGAPAGGNPGAGPSGGLGGGLAGLMPLLQLLGPLFAHLFGGGAGGGQPQLGPGGGAGAPALGPAAGGGGLASTSRAPGTI